MRDYEIFDCGDIPLQSGETLQKARLAFKTYGQLNSTGSNAILFPTWYSARHTQNEWLIGEDRALDPERWFIIVPNLFGNGLSSSPSTTPSPQDRARFPHVSIYDNVIQQHRLLTEHLGIRRLALVLGRSMGAMQAYQYASLYPDRTGALIAITGAARTSPHNYVFLASLKAALTADQSWCNGDYKAQPVAGLHVFGRIYASWIYSQEWYRHHHYLEPGVETLEDFLVKKWDTNFSGRDANDLLSHIETWQQFDISNNPVFNGHFEAALASIQAPTLIMPGKTDMYFPPEDSAYEASHIPNAKLRVIPSIRGHRAGAPGAPAEEILFLDNAIRDILN